MAVLILHPTEELIFAKLQKELISDFFLEGRLLYAIKPLWIQFDAGKPARVELGDLEATTSEIFVPVSISNNEATIKAKLSLIKIHSGKEFSEAERKAISQKKQPVRQLKIFRLGKEKELSSNSKCITESKWCKTTLHHARSTVE